MQSSISSSFPILDSPLVYLDSAASSLTPTPVLAAMDQYYTAYRSNVHRGLYETSETATQAFEEARNTVAQFIDASPTEVVWTSGATLSLNMAANLATQQLQPGDHVLLTRFEHHSNYLPWQRIAQERGLELTLIDPDPDTFTITAEMVARAITPRTRVIAMTQISNVTGLVLPIAEIAAIAREHNIMTIIDACQSVAHMPVSFRELGVDFLAFSGHKMYGPTGIGVLVIREGLHDQLEPWILGGGMVDVVSSTTSTWHDAPSKFEAGTPPIAEAVGLGAAIDWINASGGITAFADHETALYTKLIDALQSFSEITLIGFSGDARHHRGAVSFLFAGVHGHDVAAILAEHNVAVRAGHHCCQPLMQLFGVASTTRVSLGAYSTAADIEKLGVALGQVRQLQK